MSKVIPIIVLATTFSTAIIAAEPYGPFNLQSGRVQSDDDRGKTAHRSQCYEATADRFFQENSWKAEVISQVGKNTSCSIHGIERKDITLRNGDLVVPMSVPHKFCVAAHAETGSGFGNIGKPAWIECNISAVLVEYTK